MSVSRLVIAFVLGLAGLALFLTAFWYSLSKLVQYQEGHSNERAAAAQYYSDTAQHGPSSCRTVVEEDGLIAWLTCLADNVSTDGSVKHAEYDLKAQQDMAVWAFGMLIATIWLTVITLLGVYFVWRTLVATQNMARDARDIGEAQVRAYLTPTLVEVSYIPTNSCLRFKCKISNHGQSPAIDAYALVKVHFFTGDGTVEHKLLHEIGAIPTGENEGPPISYSDARIAQNSFISSSACHIQVRIIARDVFGKRVEASAFFMAGGPPEGGVTYVISTSAGQVHEKIGLRLKEADFAHLVPNWRKPNWGNNED